MAPSWAWLLFSGRNRSDIDLAAQDGFLLVEVYLIATEGGNSCRFRIIIERK